MPNASSVTEIVDNDVAVAVLAFSAKLAELGEKTTAVGASLTSAMVKVKSWYASARRSDCRVVYVDSYDKARFGFKVKRNASFQSQCIADDFK